MPPTKEWEKASPVILNFKTAPAGSITGLRYTNAQGPMWMQLIFMDISRFDAATSASDGAELTSRFDEDDLSEAKQSTCGKLFKELWSDDPAHGFPHPKGCYHRMVSTYMREVVMIFEPRNGLMPGHRYQVVLNAYPSVTFDNTQELMMVNLGDDLDSKRYERLEMAHAYTSKTYQIGAGRNDPQFGPVDGFKIVDSTSEGLYSFARDPSFEFHFRGGSLSTAKISRGCQLTMWMWPLTSWILPIPCSDVTGNAPPGSLRIDCSVVVGNFRRCGVIGRCGGNPVVSIFPITHVAEIKVTLPHNMNDLYGTMIYRMRISGLPIPSRGLLPHRLMVQIARDDGSRPNTRLSGGSYLWMPPQEYTAVARLMTDGANDVPFQDSTAYLLYAKLMLSTTIRGSDFRPGGDWYREDSTITVIAPEGFSLLGVVQARVDLGMSLVTQDGDAIAGLSELQVHEAPTGFGAPELSGWACADNRCTYTLPERSMIAAGSSLVMGFYLRPKNTSLAISDPSNLWVMRVSSPGESPEHTIVYDIKFFRTGIAGVPVLGGLTDALVQPTRAVVSNSSEPRLENELRIFFRTDQKIITGYIDVVAPIFYEFDLICSVYDLDDAHYVSGPMPFADRIPGILSCDSLRPDNDPGTGARSIARIRFDGPLKAGHYYAFGLRTYNPPHDVGSAEYNASEETYSWNLWTRDVFGGAVSSTREQARQAWGVEQSYQLRAAMLPALESMEGALAAPTPGVAVHIDPLIPFQVTFRPATANMVILLTATLQGELRVVAPQGYEWLQQLVVKRPGAPWNQMATFQDMPGDVALRSLGGMLIFTEATYLAGVRYGFESPIYVPEFSPVVSAPAFYIDLAPVGRAGRGQGLAAVLPAPLVRSVSDGAVRFTSRLPGEPTRLMLQLRLAAPVAHPAVLRVAMPAGYHVEQSELLRPWPGAGSPRVTPSQIHVAHLLVDATCTSSQQHS